MTPRDLLRLAHLAHPLPSGATVLAALGFACLFRPRAALARPGRRLLLLGLMVGAQQVAISLHNDWCDRDLDRAGKPWRAIPAGLVPAPLVRRGAWALALLSLLCAAPAGPRLVLLDAAGTGAGFLYNARLKRTRWSWLPFACAFPLLPLFGAAARDAWPRRWWSLFLVGAPLVLAVHLSDTIPDLEADARAGVGGLAHRLGRERARRLCLGALAGGAGAAAAGGVALRALPAVAGSATGLALAGLALALPEVQRLAVPAAAAATGLGWVATLARPLAAGRGIP